ncbi:MAG TPA: TIM barrel protein, partial [Chloroflexota bacterium]|nr:TIM barrel protein [Chloroflexota bacterium]
ECLRRISIMAEMIEAKAVLVHAITPMVLETHLSETLRREKLEASLPLVEHSMETAEECGVVPLLENIPPVARQRQAAFMVTPIGMSAEDLVFFAEAFPGLGATVDLSHAQLFLNGLRMDPATAQPQFVPLVRYLSTLEDSPSIDQYLERVGKYLFEVHVSNARGLLEEGLPYGDGDLDIDALVPRLGRTARYIVTETIEPNADRGVRMREAQRRLQAALLTIPGDDACPAHQEDPI